MKVLTRRLNGGRRDLQTSAVKRSVDFLRTVDRQASQKTVPRQVYFSHLGL